jgi:hypothetical protein
VGTVSQVMAPPGSRTQFSNCTPARAAPRGANPNHTPPSRAAPRRVVVNQGPGRRPLRSPQPALVCGSETDGIGEKNREQDIHGGHHCWDDGSVFSSHPGMYTDWTAVILLLLTAVPLAAVVGTAAFFIWQQRKKQMKRP